MFWMPGSPYPGWSVTNPPSLPAPAAISDVSQVTVSTPNPSSSGIDPTTLKNATNGQKIPLSALGLARIGPAIIFGPFIANNVADFGLSYGFPADPTGNRQIREIAFDSKVVWTLDGGFTGDTFTFRFYEGRQDQAADPLEAGYFPGAACAYRPQMVLFIEQLDLTPYGNKVPYVAAVIGDITGGADPTDGINIGTALEYVARSPWTGYDSSTFEAVNVIDVIGGILLADSFSFIQLCRYICRILRHLDLLQSDKLRIRDHGSRVFADITLTLDDIVAADQPIQILRQEPAQSPRILELITIDPDADFMWVPTTAQRPRFPAAVTSSTQKDTVTLPLIMNAQTRAAMVNYCQYAEEVARNKVTFAMLVRALEVEPGDRVALVADGIDDEIFKVTKTTHGANFVVQCEAESILRCSLNVDSSYRARAVHFSNNTNLLRISEFDGVADSYYGLVSGWTKMSTGPLGANGFVFADAHDFFLNISQDDTDGSGILWNTANNRHITFATNTGVASANWRHFLFSWDTHHAIGSKIIQIAIDGVLQTVPISSEDMLNEKVGWTAGFFGKLGFQTHPGPQADVADYSIYNLDHFVDLSDSANIALFISGGKPVNPDVAIAALGQPLVLFSGGPQSFSINQGTGGSFSVGAGPLTEADTSPSD